MLALVGCGSDLHVSASELPLAANVHIAEDVEIGPGVTPTYARDLLLTVPNSVSPTELRRQEREALQQAGWKFDPVPRGHPPPAGQVAAPNRNSGLVAAHNSDAYVLFGPGGLMLRRGFIVKRLGPSIRQLGGSGQSVVAVQMSPPSEY
jgi:hypothetical protein